MILIIINSMPYIFNNYMTLTLPNGIHINYKKVPVANTSYSKIVLENDEVAILICDNKWSTGHWNNNTTKRQLIFDSEIILYVLSADFKELFNPRYPITEIANELYNEFMRELFPDPDVIFPSVEAFSMLSVSFIPKNTIFNIQENEYGGEIIEIIDFNNYMSA